MTELERHFCARTRRLTITLAGITILYAVVTMIAQSDGPLFPTSALCLLSISTSTAVIVWLSRGRATATMRTCAIAYAVNLVPAVGFVWFAQKASMDQGRYWVPFEPYKLGALLLALFAPPVPWVGAFGVFSAIGSAMGLYALSSESARGTMAAGEPWTTITYGCIAVGLWTYRLSHYRREAASFNDRVEMQVVRRNSRAFIAVRDLANTPLQTLEVALYLLRGGEVDRAMITEHMKQAVRQLNELTLILGRYTETLPSMEHQESFDALEYLLRESERTVPDTSVPGAPPPRRR